jgi:NAD-dependent dihydropyrimidine dehydrogenase PreA subunit
MYQVEKLLDKMSESFVVKSSLCSRVRHKRSECSDCIEACPENALTITRAGGKVIVDWAECNSCGKCLTACKNGVFELRSVDRASLINDIKENCADGKLSFSCGKSGKKNGMVTKRTLFYINHKAILRAVYHGANEITFVHGECSKCQYKDCLASLENEIFRCEKILELADIHVEFSIKDSSELAQEKVSKKRETLASRLGKPDEMVSRREFFGMFRKKAKESVGKTVHYLSEGESVSRKTVLGSEKASDVTHVSVLKALGGETLIDNMKSEGLLKNVLIDSEKCKNCGVCAKVCSFDVFTPVKEEIKGRQVITSIDVSSAGCTGCRICEMSCLAKAISVI